MNSNSVLLLAITALVLLATIGVWGLLFALVKLKSGLESRLDAIQAAFAASGPQSAVLDARRQPAGAAAHDARPRTEIVPAAPSPDIDLRTGIITVAQEEPRPAKAAQQKPMLKTQSAAPLPVTKTPDQPQVKKSKPLPVPGEDEFDFEKEIASLGGRATPVDYGYESLDTKAIHTDKTMQWNKEELKRAAGRPDSIVVNDAEQPKKPEKPDVIVPAPGTKREDAMISGEDIESTLDSFFGLGDK